MCFTGELGGEEMDRRAGEGGLHVSGSRWEGLCSVFISFGYSAKEPPPAGRVFHVCLSGSRGLSLITEASAGQTRLCPRDSPGVRLGNTVPWTLGQDHLPASGALAHVHCSS